MTYQAEVTREGRWWMVAIPELDGLTQARHLREAADMAREYIAAATDTPLEDVEVEVTVKAVDGVRVAEELAKIRRERARAAQLEMDASARTARLAQELVAARVPMRDVGALLHVSHQRVHQLVSHR